MGFAETVKTVIIRYVILENKKKEQKQIHCNFTVSSPAIASQLLADTSGLPKERIKHAMIKGAVWLKQPGKKERRLRKAKFKLQTNDYVQLFYDASVLAQTPPQPTCVAGYDDFSVWFKPPWLLSQGSRYGDHCSLLRLAEKSNRAIDFKLIHRLDREASGLMLLAHNRNAAMLLSRLFQDNKIEKRYFAEVHGEPDIPAKGLQLTSTLDDKDARTEILAVFPGKTEQSRVLDIQIHTGRLHQIRRHLAELGLPVIGDKKYGEEHAGGHCELHLCAWKINFFSPFSGKQVTFQVPREIRPSFLNGITS